MNKAVSDAKTVFLAALEKESPGERARYLDEFCQESSDLRARVEQLLRAHEHAGKFLGGAEVTVAPERSEVSTDGPANSEGHQSTSADEIPLDFLSPSKDPEALGRIGPYDVTGVVGRGGMGVVLKAEDTKLNRNVAIKVLAPELASNPTARKRFVREAQAAAAVVHQHVVTIHGVDEDRLPYLVMEYIDGQSLQEKIDRQGHLELREILRIGQQVATGLAAAHAQGLMHRDVKPANILLENGVERVRITDFGLARAVEDVGMTRAGDVAGTPQYMSPEQAQGLPMDAKSDLFSLGCVLYAMCTGRSPFRAETAVAVMRRVCDDTPRPIREVNPDIPQWLIEIIDRLLDKRPDVRFQTAAEVAELLGKHLAELQHPAAFAMVATPGPKSAIHNPHSKIATRPWAIAAAAVVLLLVGILLTEATGVTKVAATVIRIFTPEGTLIVEVDDPGVKVTIEGDRSLVITGAGLHEFHLAPGNYKLQADKNGQPVPLERKLVSIARDGREVVRVKLETPPPPKVETDAFVLLAAGNEHKFDSLAEAVQAASDGDTIEIRGNGPFVTRPITSGNLGLTLRAAARYRPIVQFSRDSGSHPSRLFAGTTSLTLEGLEFRGPPPGPNDDSVAFDAGISLHVANCRFLLPQAICFWSGDNTRRCVLRNCEFLGSPCITALAGGVAPGGNWLVDNCVQLRGTVLSYHWCPPEQDNSLQLTRCTCVGSADWDFPIGLADARKLEPGQTPKVVQLSVSGCVLDCKYVLGAPRAKDKPLQELLKWSGGQNVYRIEGGPADRLLKTGMESVLDPPDGPADLAAWREFWRTPEAGSLEGRVRYKGGNLIARLETAPHELTPDNFRLRSDSPGYGAGPDGKDLGADASLVGPGKAYEDWKETPEYQDWLKESGQMK